MTSGCCVWVLVAWAVRSWKTWRWVDSATLMWLTWTPLMSQTSTGSSYSGEIYHHQLRLLECLYKVSTIHANIQVAVGHLLEGDGTLQRSCACNAQMILVTLGPHTPLKSLPCRVSLLSISTIHTCKQVPSSHRRQKVCWNKQTHHVCISWNYSPRSWRVLQLLSAKMLFAPEPLICWP